MKRVRKHIGFPFLLVIAVSLISSTAIAQRNPTGRRQRPAVEKTQQEPPMTNAEKLATWKGQKVTILGTQPVTCPARSDSRLFFRKPESGERDFLPYDKYAGQTGLIVEAVMGSYEPEVVVQLDKTAEKIVTKGNDGFASQSELETAKGLLGRSLWSRGPNSLALKDSVCVESTKRDRFDLKNLQRVTITAVELGHHLQPIYLLLKTDDGKEGWLTGWDGYDHFDGKFHLTSELAGVPNLHYTFRFHTDDPRKLHPDWKAPIWKLIENSEIAIGMTEEMAKMTCGRDIRTAGFVLSGGDTSPIYLCHYKKFLVENGKVTKYVE